MKRPTISKRNFLKVVKSFEPCKQGLNRLKRKLKGKSTTTKIIAKYIKSFWSLDSQCIPSNSASDWLWLCRRLDIWWFSYRCDAGFVIGQMNGRLRVLNES